MNKETPSRPAPTLFQIISTDYLAQNFFVMIFGGWAIYFIDGLFEGETTLFLLIFAAICTPIGLAAFFWRFGLITSTFVNGVEITGQVTRVEIITTGKNRQDRIIHYKYDFNGQNHEFRNRVKKNNNTKTVSQGSQVTLLVHEKTPHIAFIKNIYLEYL